MIIIGGSAFFGFLALLAIFSGFVEGTRDNARRRAEGDPTAMPFFASLPGILIVGFSALFLLELRFPVWLVLIGVAVYFIWMIHVCRKVWKAQHGGF